MLTALLVLGGNSLADFVLALILGIVAGTVSTVTVAVPFTAALDRRWPPPPGPATSSARRASAARREDGAVV